MLDVFGLGVAVQTAVGRTGWEGWPFGGETSPWLAGALRILFTALVFAALAWGLRLLFGPGGHLRPKEFGTAHIAERKERKRRTADIYARYKAGELDADEYREALARLERGD
ncbi:SHOCT domain-containing protein [Desulfocurvus sp. DL9XJH121]